MGRKRAGYLDSGAQGSLRTTKRAELDRLDREAERELVDGSRRFLVEECRKLAPAALVVIEEVMNSPASEPKDRLAAAKLVLEQGYGRAPSTRERPAEGGVTVVVQRFSEPLVRQVEAQLSGPRTVIGRLPDGTEIEKVN